MAWLDRWNKRLKCTIDSSKVDADLTNYPVLVSLKSYAGINDFNATPVIESLTTTYSGLMYFQDFTDAGSAGDWWEISGPGDIYDFTTGYMRNNNTPGTGVYAVAQTYRNFTYVSDFEFFISMKQAGTGSSAADQFFYLFRDYNQSTTSSSPFVLLFLCPYPSTNKFFMQVINETGTVVVNADQTKYNYNAYATSWFHVRVKRSGNTYYFKHWRESESEPSGWDSTQSYSGITYFSGPMHAMSRTNVEASYDNITLSGTWKQFDINKIAITTSDGQTQCPAEIDCADYVNGAYLWTKIPAVASGTDTVFYLYYDKTEEANITYVSGTNSLVAESVWDSNYVGVYHFGKFPMNYASYLTDSFQDSSATHNHGQPSGFEGNDFNYDRAGKTWNFSGDEYITIPDHNTLDFTSSYTIESLIYPTAKEQVNQVFNKATSDAAGWQLRGDTGNLNFNTGTGSGLGNLAYNNNTWYYVTVAVSTTSGIMRANDVVVDAKNTMTNLAVTTNNLLIGKRWDSWYFKGNMGEIRFSNTRRSDAYLKANYYNLFDDLISYEDQQIVLYTCSGIVTVDGSPTNDIVVRLYDRNTGELMDSSTSYGGGYFDLESTTSGNHYVVALYTTSGTNALIYDWMSP